MKVLDSVRVLEIGGLGPGPFCAMHLADLGADVISVVREAPNAGPTGNLLNRGKRSVFADLKTGDGRRLVLDLVKDADALIEGMRPGVMERLGLGPADCHAVNPRLVYGRMTGWGQSGPLAPRAGHDNNYAAVSGALWGSSPAGARPVSPFAVLGDIGGGALYLMAGLLAGIVQARATGRGTVVDAAIVDGAAHMLNLNLSAREKGLVADQRAVLRDLCLRRRRAHHHRLPGAAVLRAAAADAGPGRGRRLFRRAMGQGRLAAAPRAPGRAVPAPAARALAGIAGAHGRVLWLRAQPPGGRAAPAPARTRRVRRAGRRAAGGAGATL